MAIESILEEFDHDTKHNNNVIIASKLMTNDIIIESCAHGNAFAMVCLRFSRWNHHRHSSCDGVLWQKYIFGSIVWLQLQ